MLIQRLCTRLELYLLLVSVSLSLFVCLSHSLSLLAPSSYTWIYNHKHVHIHAFIGGGGGGIVNLCLQNFREEKGRWYPITATPPPPPTLFFGCGESHLDYYGVYCIYWFSCCVFHCCRPLHIAAKGGLVPVVQDLISKGGSVLALDESGEHVHSLDWQSCHQWQKLHTHTHTLNWAGIACIFCVCSSML